MSTACRDWLKTLWAASFKGVPFYFEQDKEAGGRGLVIHTFPNRDDPFIEDLGEEPRFYSGSAYVHGDNADSLASALKSVLASRGPGTLVVPYFGPVTVHCQTFERSTQRDQMGYVGFELKMVRAGASTGFVSVPLLQNIAFTAADTLAAVTAQQFPQTITTLLQPDHVVAAVTDTLSNAAASIDVLRQSLRVDPTASATIRDAVIGLVGDIPNEITGDTAPGIAASAVASTLIATARSLGDALPADSAVSAGLQLADAYPATAATATLAAAPFLVASNDRADDNAAAAARVARLAGLTMYAEGILRSTFASRPDGVTARGEVAERFENELYNTAGAADAQLYLSIDALRGTVIDWLTQTIVNLAPVIKVETARVLPSLYLAWVLYSDPTRAGELVARNDVVHPSFMPRTIEALSR